MNKNLRDALNLLSKLTWFKALNMCKVVASYLASKVMKRPMHAGMPMSISFEPTTSCNLRCPECPSGLRSFTRPTGMLPADLFKQTIDELEDTLMYLLFYFQGEPFLHPQFLDLVQYASSKGIYTATSTNAHFLHDQVAKKVVTSGLDRLIISIDGTTQETYSAYRLGGHPQFLDLVQYASSKGIYTATSTNAHFLHDQVAKKVVTSGLDRLIISIDGTTQETYSAYRLGGKLDKVLEGTKNVLRWKKELKSSTPHVIFQFLVVKPNQHQMAEVRELAKSLGVDTVGFKTAQIYDYEKGSELIPTLDKFSRYKASPDGTFKIKNQLLNHCWKMWHSCVITWDGKVVPCCFDKDAHYMLGDVSKTSFKALWKSDAYQNFRGSLIRSRSEIEMCKNCTEGTRVWA